MPARNALLNAPPYAVEQSIRTLGQNLRTARLHRNLSIADIAEKIGVHRRVVGDAERGKLSTSIAVYVALLWALGLSEQLADVASPDKDEVGSALSLAHDRKRARSTPGPNNDF